MKAAVVYWSGTGNTAAMADLVLEGMQRAGAQADLMECTAVTDLSPYEAGWMALSGSALLAGKK